MGNSTHFRYFENSFDSFSLALVLKCQQILKRKLETSGKLTMDIDFQFSITHVRQVIWRASGVCKKQHEQIAFSFIHTTSIGC